MTRQAGSGSVMTCQAGCGPVMTRPVGSGSVMTCPVGYGYENISFGSATMENLNVTPQVQIYNIERLEDLLGEHRPDEKKLEGDGGGCERVRLQARIAHTGRPLETMKLLLVPAFWIRNY